MIEDPTFWRDFWYVWSMTLLPASILCGIIAYFDCKDVEKRYGNGS